MESRISADQRFNSRLSRRKFLGALITTPIAIAAVACGGETRAPNGMSRDTRSYQYKIIVQVFDNKSEDVSVNLFTNEKPELALGNGTSKLTGHNLYCPKLLEGNGEQSDERVAVGCTGEFMTDYEVSTQKRISISSQGSR